jgi:hypothetical protein
MAIAFVQSKSGTGSGAGAATTASMTSTSGNAMIVMVATNTSTDNEISTVVDSKLNGYTRVTSKSYNFSEVEILVCTQYYWRRITYSHRDFIRIG